MVRRVSYFTYFFSNSLGSLGAHLSRGPAPTWALWMDYLSPHTMFAKTLLHFENNLKKMLIFKGSATNRSQNIVWIIFMPLIPVSDVSEEQTSEMTVLSAATSEKWTSF